MKRFLSTLLFVLSILSLFAATITIALTTFQNTETTSIEGFYQLQRHFWIFWLFALIPVGCLLFGIFCKRIKNLVIGIIFTALLVTFGSMAILTMSFYSTDISYIDSMEDELGIYLPSGGSIVTHDWTKGNQKTTFDLYLKYESVARFNNANTDGKFLSELSTQKWQSSNESIVEITPRALHLETQNCDYFLLYCYETKSFAHSELISKYNYVYMAYDRDEAILYITEFVCK